MKLVFKIACVFILTSLELGAANTTKLNQIVPYINAESHRFASPAELTQIEDILKSGVNVDEVDEKYGSTPLMFAAQWGDLALVQLLLKYGADPTAKSSVWKFAWKLAAPDNNLDAVLTIANAIGKLNYLVPAINSALNRKATSAELIQIEEMLKSGADVDEGDERWGSTPLMFAAQRGDLGLVKLLLKYDADPRAKNNDRNSVWLYAKEGGSAVVLSIVNAMEKLGFLGTLCGAASKATRTKLIQIEEILKAGADVNERDKKYNYTLLMLATQKADWPLVRLLLKYGAEPTGISQITTKYRNFLSSIYEDLKRPLTRFELIFVDKLLKSGANVDEEDESKEPTGSTPLMLAAQHGDLRMVELLIKHGADADAINFNGISVLDFAIKSNNQELIYYVKSARFLEPKKTR